MHVDDSLSYLPLEKLLVPMENFGVKCMSMGFLVPEDAPTIWRGPMVMGAISQLLYSVAWGPLDILVVDLPPGTGDAQLTLTQQAPLSGAVIVSTPQDIALIDVRRGVNMFRKVDVPVFLPFIKSGLWICDSSVSLSQIFGIVENMSYFECPQCKHHEHVFGKEGARNTAAEMGLEFLCEIPINSSIRFALHEL